MTRSPVPIAFSGLPGSGKSTLAQRLARDYQAWTRPCLRVDTAGRSVETVLAELRHADALNKPA